MINNSLPVRVFLWSFLISPCLISLSCLSTASLRFASPRLSLFFSFSRIKAHPCHPIGQSALIDSWVQHLDTGPWPRHHHWSSHAGPRSDRRLQSHLLLVQPKKALLDHRRCRRTTSSLLSSLLFLTFITYFLSIQQPSPPSFFSFYLFICLSPPFYSSSFYSSFQLCCIEYKLLLI